MQFGISAALLTPFGSDGAIDAERLVDHAVDVTQRGASGITLFGTTGEGPSIGTGEREAVLAQLSGSLSADRIVLGISAASVEDAAAHVRQGLAHGIRDFLLSAPFYYSAVDDDGLFAWHSQLIQATAAEARFVLYNIPQVTGVALSPALAGRLGASFPDRIQAIKDSSGDWATSSAFLSEGRLPVLIGDERLLHRALPLGCAGSISGMANLYPERMASVFSQAREDAALSRLVDRIVSGPVNAGLKVLLARDKNDPAWEAVRPPLSPLGRVAREELLNADSLEPVDE